MNFKTVLALLVAIVPATAADPFIFANWTASTATTATGSISSITVNYSSSDIFFVQTGNTNTQWLGYNPAATWQGGTVANAPTNAQIIAITAAAVTHTITFSQPVTNVAMDLVSLGSGGHATQYIFNAPFSILNIGPSTQFGGGTNTLVASAGNTLTGREGDGVIMFAGPLTSISWTGVNPEVWNGFTFGLDSVTNGLIVPTPVPPSILLTLIGLAGAGFVFYLGARRRERRA